MLCHVKEHVSLMVESAKDFAIIAFDTNRRTIIWNPGAEWMFGYKPEEIIGKSAELIFTPEDRKNHVPDQEFETAIKTGHAEDERWHLRKDGSRFFVSGVMMAMHNAEGELIGFAKIARDITPLKHTQEMLIEARNRAEAANTAKTEFLATMSHEIRTPMNAIIGLSEILQRSQPLTEKQKEYVETLHKSAGFLLSLIDNLLDISRIEARTVELEKIPFSLIEIIQDVIKIMTLKAGEKHLALTMEADCIKDCRFQGDPARVRQVILNLCSNAVKFTERGGIHILVMSQHTDRAAIEDVAVSVKDTGIGIAPDKIATIFEKFTQGDSSINRKYGGSGLGLAITKNLVELMGGTITVNSDIDKGSTFTVRLPLVREE
jgi:PAS domain S-box-containing protein